jgi:hypothetical protein
MSDQSAAELGAALSALNITQRRAAELFAVTSRHIRRWKSGDRRLPHAVAIVLHLLARGVVTIDQVAQAAGLVAARTNGGAEDKPSAPLAEASQERTPAPAALARVEAATLADPSVTTAQKVYALTANGCRWPTGDPQLANFCFCTRRATRGPYCAEHYAEACLAPRPQQPPSRLLRRFGYRLPAARQVPTVMRVSTHCPFVPNPSDLGTTSSQRP